MELFGNFFKVNFPFRILLASISSRTRHPLKTLLYLTIWLARKPIKCVRRVCCFVSGLAGSACTSDEATKHLRAEQAFEMSGFHSAAPRMPSPVAIVCEKN